MGVCISTKHSEKEFYMGYGSFNIIRNKIADYVPATPSKGTVSFLEQPDCEGKLTPKECRGLLKDIQFMEDDGSRYGYYWCQRTLSDFKELLNSCIKHRCNLTWN